jgi:hypothetical protein
MHSKRVAIVIILFLMVACYSVGAVKVQYDAISADGYLSNSNIDYSLARNSMDADTIDDAGMIKIGQTSGAQWSIYRGYFYFDTSAIPDNARAQKAWLYFYVVNNPKSVRVLADQGSTVPRSPALTADSFYVPWYDLHGPPLSVSSTGWNNIIITDKLIAEGVPISNTGITKFAVLSVDDYQENEVDIGIMNIHSADNANKPYLKVQYNTPPATPTLEGSSNGTIKTTYKLSITSTDSDTETENNKIKYKIQWGDGKTSWEPSYYAESGETVTASHRYKDIGKHTIQVTAYDNSGEDNDHSGIASKTVDIGEGPLPGEKEEGILSKILSFFTGLISPKDDGPNPAFHKLRARYFNDEQGQKHLAIWWDINNAAYEQNNLIVQLQIKTISGITNLGTFNARDHTTQENAFVVLNWDQKFSGHEQWSFTIRAMFLNAVNVGDEEAKNQEISLVFLLGLPMYVENIILFFIVLIVIIIILLLYKFRETIFWKRYIDIKSDAELNRLYDKGFIKDFLKKTKKRRKLEEKIKEKPGSIFENMLKDIKDYNKRRKTDPVSAKYEETEEKKGTKPVKTKKQKQKEKKQKEKEIKKTKKRKQKVEEEAIEIMAKDIQDILENPRIYIPPKLLKNKLKSERTKATNLEKYIRENPNQGKAKAKTLKNISNRINYLTRLQALEERKRDLMYIAKNNEKIDKKLLGLYQKGLFSENKELADAYSALLKGDIDEKDAERHIADTYNKLNKETQENLNKLKYDLQIKTPSRKDIRDMKNKKSRKEPVRLEAKKQPKRTPTKYQKFAAEKRKEGYSFKEVGELWRQEQEENKAKKIYEKHFDRVDDKYKKKHPLTRTASFDKSELTTAEKKEARLLIKRIEDEKWERVNDFQKEKLKALDNAKLQGLNRTEREKIKDRFENRIGRIKNDYDLDIEKIKKKAGFKYDQNTIDENEKVYFNTEDYFRRKKNKQKKKTVKKIGMKNKKQKRIGKKR